MLLKCCWNVGLFQDIGKLWYEMFYFTTYFTCYLLVVNLERLQSQRYTHPFQIQLLSIISDFYLCEIKCFFTDMLCSYLVANPGEIFTIESCRAPCISSCWTLHKCSSTGFDRNNRSNRVPKYVRGWVKYWSSTYQTIKKMVSTVFERWYLRYLVPLRMITRKY